MQDYLNQNINIHKDKNLEQKVLNLTRHYAHFPTHTVWLKSNKNYFSNNLGIVAFEETSKSFVVAGDPLCPNAEDNIELFNCFINWAHQNNKSVCGYYFSEKFVKDVKGLMSIKAGVSRYLDLDKCDLAGYESRDIRRAVNHGRKSQLLFYEVPHNEKPVYKERLKALEAEWLKGKRLPRIKFLLSEISDSHLGAKEEKWYVVSQGDEFNIQAMVSVNTYFENDRPVAYIDHLLQFESGHKFALDYLLARLIQDLQKKEYVVLNLGFCPFQKVKAKGLVGMGLWFNKWLEPLYASRGLYKYKRKFTDCESSRYLLIDESYSTFSQIRSLFKVTFNSEIFH